LSPFELAPVSFCSRPDIEFFDGDKLNVFMEFGRLLIHMNEC